MKKILTSAAAVLLLLSLVSCNGDRGKDTTTKAPDTTKTPDTTSGLVVDVPDTTVAPDTTTTPDTPTNPEEFVTVDETVYVVGAASVNLRTAPDSSSDETKSGLGLKSGDSVKRIAISESWSKVLYEGKEYYIVSKYLSTEKPADIVFTEVNETVYVVNAESLTLRSTPEVADYSAVGAVAAGTEMKRIGTYVEDATEGTGWSKVIYKDVTYFVRSYYLSTEKPATDTTAAPAN